MNFPALDYNILCLELCAGLLAFLPLVPIFLWRKRHGKAASLRFLLWGGLGFLVSARVLELGVHMVCLMLDSPVSRFLNGHTWAYALYGAAMAGIFEEVGRWVVLGKLVKKDKTPENALMYGLGHGGVEVWLVFLPAILQYLVVALQLRDLGLAGTMAALGVAADQEALFAQSFSAIGQFDGAMVFLNLFERAGAMVLHVALTMVVFYGLQKGDKKYLLLAVLAHAIVDLPAALSQRGALPLWSVEVWIALCDIALVVWAVKLYRQLKEEPA